MNQFIEGALANLLGSWRTTLMGAIAAIPILCVEIGKLIDADALTEMDPAQVGLALGALGLGAFARDNNKSSRDVGAN